VSDNILRSTRSRTFWVALSIACVTCGLLLVAACTTGGGGGGPLGGNSVVLTGLFIDGVGDVRVDDHVVAVGTGQNGGIEYVIPAQGSATHPANDGGGTLQVRGFNVANGWIAARFLDGSVIFHHTTDQTTIEVDEDDLVLPAGAASDLEFYADDDFMAVLADPARVADGHELKFIDFSQDSPVITSFTQDLPNIVSERVVLGFDADRREVVALKADVFYRYDMDHPDNAPEEFDVGGMGGAVGSPLFQYDNGFLIYLSRDLNPDGRRLAMIANLDDQTTTELDEQPAANLDLLMRGGNFAYFARQDDGDDITNDQTRTAWGTVNGSIELTDLHETDVLIGDDREDGLIGYGLSLAATKDGRFRFIAGGGNPAVAEFLQVSEEGGAFEVVPTIDDFRNQSPDGLPGTEVVTSNAMVAFRVGGDDEVGYILLP